jgi:hypothetical protein
MPAEKLPHQLYLLPRPQTAQQSSPAWPPCDTISGTNAAAPS